MSKKTITKTEKLAKYMPLFYIIPLVIFIITAACIIIYKEVSKNTDEAWFNSCYMYKYRCSECCLDKSGI